MGKRWGVWAILRSFDLRFHEHELEASYKESLERTLVRALTGCTAFVVFAAVVNSKPIVAERNRSDLPFRCGLEDPRTLFSLIMMTHIAVSMVIVVCGAMYLRVGTLRKINWEVVALLVCIYFLIATPFAGKWHAARVYGMDPALVWLGDTRGSESSVILALDAIITATSLYIPIRSGLNWLIPLGGMFGLTSVVAVAGSPFPENIAINISFFLALTCFSFLGANRNEMHIRQKFLAERQVQKSMEIVMSKEVQLSEASTLVKSMKAVATGLCEIVIQLDADLRILYDDPVRDALFGAPLSGILIRDTIVAEEWSRVIQVFERATVSSLPQLLPVSFQSDLCQRLETQVLVVSTGLSMPRYLVGVQRRDFEELIPARCETQFRPVLPGAPSKSEKINDEVYVHDLESEVSFVYSQTTYNTCTRAGKVADASAQTESAALARPPAIPGSRKTSYQECHGRSRSPRSRSTSPGSGPVAPICNKFGTTPRASAAFMLRETSKHMNWLVSSGYCCQWHASLDALSKLTRQMSDDQCALDWAVEHDWQCFECYGLNCRDASECQVCGLEFTGD